jgi:glycosyltransferase involved in cell wall biosynthesis
VKKIFYIANIRIPTEKAHGIQIMKTCEALAQQGTPVTLIVPRRFNALKADPFEYYGVQRVFNIVRVPTLDLVFLGKIGFLIETIIFSECATWYIRLHSKFGRGKNVYSRDVWPLLNVSLLGWNIFWEAHMGSKSFVTRKLLGRLTGLVAISHGLKKLYMDLGMKEEKIIVSPDAVDVTKFDVQISQQQAREKLGLPIGAKIVMYIGLLDEWKGYRTFLDASNILSSKTEFSTTSSGTSLSIECAVIGGTDAQISSLKKEYPKVHFLGYKEYSELPQNQKAANVLVIPNSAKFPISQLYTSPLKLFAHMMSGVPIVASDLPSIREIVSEAEVVFCRPDDPVDLAKKIQNVVSSSENDQNRLTLAAKQKVARYTWDNRALEILHFLEKSR